MANYKVVETNNLMGLRSGHIIAQTPLKIADYPAAAVVENGLIFNLVGDHLVLGDATKPFAPLLHYTEELFFDYNKELKEFAVKWIGEGAERLAYPRCIVLHIGDTFTTNNVVEIGTGAFATYADGVIVQSATLPVSGHAFAAVVSTLPDGITEALELTYLGYLGAGE